MDGLFANLDARIHPHSPITVPHGLPARPIASRPRCDIHRRWRRVVPRASDSCADNGPGGEAAQQPGGYIAATGANRRCRRAAKR
jgi:hypothetical protein